MFKNITLGIKVALLCVITTSCLVRAVISVSLQEDTLERNEEPVVVSGAMLQDFTGKRTDRIFVYAYQDDQWEKVVFQIDEVNGEGSYFEEDETPGILDENDEIVFMAQECGDSVAANEWVEGANDFRYAITISDGRPGEEDRKAWAYIYSSASLTPREDDYAEISNYWEWNVTTPCYVQDFVDWAPHILEEVYIRPGGGGDSTDMVDRHKMRTSIMGFVTTEESLSDTLHPDWVIDGRVRVIGYFYCKLSKLKVTEAMTYFYKAYTRVVTTVITKYFPINIDSLRYSVDFDRDLEGAMHYDNGGSGFQQDSIDGSDPGFPLLPQVKWNETNHPTAGTFVQIQDFSAAPVESLNLRSFYHDGSGDPWGWDTGEDSWCWGEAGILAIDLPKNEIFTAESWIFLLPARSEESVGGQYALYYYYPLELSSCGESRVEVSGNLAAEARKTGNLLSWNPLRNPHNDFIVYRSLTARWEEKDEIIRIPGRPSSHRYSYLDSFDRAVGATYYYWVESGSGTGPRPLMGPVGATWIPVSARSLLHQNTPNPFNPITTISYEVGRGDGGGPIPISLRIYDVGGELVDILVDRESTPGIYSALWDGTNRHGREVSAGIYHCRLVCPGQVDTKRIILLK